MEPPVSRSSSNGAASSLQEDEEVILSLADVSCAVCREDEDGDPAEREDWGVGELRVTNRRVVWERREGEARGLAVQVVDVLLHAVSRDPQTFPRPCLYAQLNLEHVAEVFFAPGDPDALAALFDAFSAAAALNPDDLQEEDEEDDDAMAGLDDGDDDDPERDALLTRFDAMLADPPALPDPEQGQFDDALDDATPDDGGDLS
mmetsp:Transcript_16281/g.51061  ORF Transcript_16281/g.51061 Transcript_16281/m.51061 type:complete len:203 (-) Transcript_16281:40-648(-)